MSLLVEVFVREPDGDMRILDVPDGVYQSGGFESWRTTVWGSEFVRSLGARFLPVPAGQDLRVEPGDVPGFQREVAVLRSRLGDVARGERPQGDRGRTAPPPPVRAVAGPGAADGYEERAAGT
ncbi:hypothetical protein RKE30_08850 [Streptomyces sp. Li-HN-5-11]|uniref:hypothetical protein n=1 Tax=Streptomyces sp. Li-HN-5-11 TaxID=3075432 RepID=UPI0028A7190B|nr:hypothetical protein [Streptomyces sp. Li-HN-5-11]WNM30504.1 hypothetical protein RKE30_08850 [Streptomyces sp. Li-HN-5-11]